MTANQTQPAEPTPTAEDPTTWEQARWDDSIRLRQADYAVGMARHMAKERLLRRLAKKTMNGTIGKETLEPEDGQTDMIVLGNYTVTIGTPPDDQAPRPPARPAPQPPAQNQTPGLEPRPPAPAPQPPAHNETPARQAPWKTLWPWLLAAAIPTAGAIGAAAANYWSARPTTADTWMDWDFIATPQSSTGEPKP